MSKLWTEDEEQAVAATEEEAERAAIKALFTVVIGALALGGLILLIAYLAQQRYL